MKNKASVSILSISETHENHESLVFKQILQLSSCHKMKAEKNLKVLTVKKLNLMVRMCFTQKKVPEQSRF